jgi:hypothetical protein
MDEPCIFAVLGGRSRQRKGARVHAFIGYQVDPAGTVMSAVSTAHGVGSVAR